MSREGIVKICGVTRPADARVAVEAGADMIGLVLWAPSPRAVGPDDARRVREAVGGDAEVVGVFVDEDPDTIERLCRELALDRVQLHGDEPAATVARFGARALRGVRDGDISRVPEGVPVVYDRPFRDEPAPHDLEVHWLAARAVAERRPLLLAGALDEARVAVAIETVRPWGVDTARGVETAPGRKDHDAVRRFVAAAKEAYA
jgi:phosphoribosylanthranilate isomerase